MTMNIAGQKFGGLTAIEDIGKDPKAGRIWRCVCDCGQSTTARARQLKSGSKKSCGCLRILVGANNGQKTKHGDARHNGMRAPTYITWQSMRQRCKGKAEYVDRGISVCKRWESYPLFLQDMGVRPEGMTIGRIDNDAGYFPENCRWETPKQQARNRRNTVIVNLDENSVSLAEYCEETGINREHIKSHARRVGWARATGAGV